MRGAPGDGFGITQGMYRSPLYMAIVEHESEVVGDYRAFDNIE